MNLDEKKVFLGIASEGDSLQYLSCKAHLWRGVTQHSPPGLEMFKAQCGLFRAIGYIEGAFLLSYLD